VTASGRQGRAICAGHGTRDKKKLFAMHQIKWSMGKSHKSFLKDLRALVILNKQRPNLQNQLKIDDALLTGFLLLDQKSEDRVIETFQMTPIKSVEVYDPSFRLQLSPQTREGKRRLAKCQRLGKVLGSITTLKEVTLYSEGIHDSTLHGFILNMLQQVVSVSIDGSWADVNGLEAGLREHSSIRKVDLKHYMLLNSNFLSVLQTLPLLDSFMARGSPVKITIDAAQAIANLLVAKETLRRFEMTNFDVHGDSVAELCDGIGRSKLESLESTSCCFRDAVAFANAITRLQLREISLMDVIVGEGGGATFLNIFAASLPTMLQLKELTCKLFCNASEGEGRKAFNEAMVGVAHAAAHCPQLTLINLGLELDLPEFDAAIADCVRSCHQLKRINVSCPYGLTEETLCSYPLLLEATRTNYTLKHVEIHSLSNASRQKINIFLILNLVGRAYMITDSANQGKAVQVLGRISYDLNCLYEHLRENPMACKVNEPKKPVQKRKSEASSSSRSPSKRRLRA
jgi:hypothetical protein